MPPIFFEDLESLTLPDDGVPSHVAVGTFDGLHRGHQELIGHVAAEALEHGGRSLVFTFRNHPRSVVDPGHCPPLLTPWPLKKRLLQRLPVNGVIAVEFTPALAMIEAEDFIREVLVDRCRACSIHSGSNFRFGHNKRGNAELLRQLAGELDYEYRSMTFVEVENDVISSTRVRRLLHEGHVGEAARLLGRPHQVAGTVVSGDRLGRTIGFPTANLAPEREGFLPADGVYAVAVAIGEEAHCLPGMMNIGWRPTVGGRQHRAEVHLLDWSGELGGCTLTVLFVERLRDEQKFAGLEELKAQLARDRVSAHAVLSGREFIAS
jgi:riboflavin kinase/FMN adenylyltransferase